MHPRKLAVARGHARVRRATLMAMAALDSWVPELGQFDVSFFASGGLTRYESVEMVRVASFGLDRLDAEGSFLGMAAWSTTTRAWYEFAGLERYDEIAFGSINGGLLVELQRTEDNQVIASKELSGVFALCAGDEMPWLRLGQALARGQASTPFARLDEFGKSWHPVAPLWPEADGQSGHLVVRPCLPVQTTPVQFAVYPRERLSGLAAVDRR